MGPHGKVRFAGIEFFVLEGFVSVVSSDGMAGPDVLQ